MSGQEFGSPEYMNAYLNGMQFILLALDGRVEKLDEEGQEVMREALTEYHELAMRMRERVRLGVPR